MTINTPEKLMRSRYKAFKEENWQYIVDTSIHQTLQDLSNPSSIKWLKLEVLKAYENIVEFKAYYKLDGKIEVLHERSTFIQVQTLWKYESGEQYPAQIKSNESCPCDSGKKFKKCCA